MEFHNMNILNDVLNYINFNGILNKYIVLIIFQNKSIFFNEV